MGSKSAWYLGGVLVLGLAILAVSCDSGVLPGKQTSPPIATIAPPSVPHSVEGRADCLLCHEKGVGGAPQYPSSHIGRPSDVCLTCHPRPPGSAIPIPSPKPPIETTPTVVLAKDLYGSRCAACHGANRQGIPGFAPALTPESLAALSDTQVKEAISDGRPSTAMPAFKGTLSPKEIDTLLELLKSPLLE